MKEGKDVDFSKILSIVKANSHLDGVYLCDWIEAAEIKSKMRKTQPDFSLIDSILLVKQKKFEAKIVSGDKHFEGMNEIVFLR